MRTIIKSFIPKAVNTYIKDLVRGDQNPRKMAMEKIFEFVKYNQIEGDYLEFGCCGAHTFRYAHDRIRKILRSDIHMFAFDSFDGLPEPKDIDVHPDFRKSQFSQSKKEFVSILDKHGVSRKIYTTVEGYYNKTLHEETARNIGLKKAAVVWIDCDLYESTVDVLRFITPYLQTGTVVVFDDFYCFNGDPDRGEQRALREYLDNNPTKKFQEYFQFSWAGKAFICKT